MDKDEKIIARAIITLQHEVDVGDVTEDDVSDLFMQIPISYLSNEVLHVVIKELEYPREILRHFPGFLFTIPIKNYLISKDPDVIFFFPPEIQNSDVDSWLIAFQTAIKQMGFTGRHSDSGIAEFWSEWVPENIRKDPRMAKLRIEYQNMEHDFEDRELKRIYGHEATKIASNELDRIRKLSKP